MRIGIPGTLPKSPSQRGPWFTAYFRVTFLPLMVWFQWYWRREKYAKLLYMSAQGREIRRANLLKLKGLHGNATDAVVV